MFPSAIILVNEDISPSVKKHLVRQLHISEVMDGYTFDGYVADGYYLEDIKKYNKRIMVTRTFDSRGDVSTWILADVVVFIKQGLASVEQNKFGPHSISYPVLKLNWHYLGVNG